MQLTTKDKPLPTKAINNYYTKKQDYVKRKFEENGLHSMETYYTTRKNPFSYFPLNRKIVQYVLQNVLIKKMESEVIWKFEIKFIKFEVSNLCI